MTRCSYCSHPL